MSTAELEAYFASLSDQELAQAHRRAAELGAVGPKLDDQERQLLARLRTARQVPTTDSADILAIAAGKPCDVTPELDRVQQQLAAVARAQRQLPELQREAADRVLYLTLRARQRALAGPGRTTVDNAWRKACEAIERALEVERSFSRGVAAQTGQHETDDPISGGWGWVRQFTGWRRARPDLP